MNGPILSLTTFKFLNLKDGLKYFILKLDCFGEVFYDFINERGVIISMNLAMKELLQNSNAR